MVTCYRSMHILQLHINNLINIMKNEHILKDNNYYTHRVLNTNLLMYVVKDSEGVQGLT